MPATTSKWLWASALLAIVLLASCKKEKEDSASTDPPANAASEPKDPEPATERVDARPAPMHQPVPLWESGKTSREIDAATASLHHYVVLDLGEEWTPYLFTERGTPEEDPLTNSYRTTYLALARGEIPKDHHGERASRDKYLELYGIMPTLGLLRKRMKDTAKLECATSLDYEPLKEFQGFIAYQSNDKAKADAKQIDFLERHVAKLVAQQNLSDLGALDRDALDVRDRQRVKELEELRARARIMTAVQARLKCEGYFQNKGKWIPGTMDWATHEALAEFERRHRVYGWGYVGKDTLEKLREAPLELERQAVIRILTERAMHAAGVIEDGSTSVDGEGEARTFKGKDGKSHPIPNLESELEKAIVKAFGLETPESTLAWLEGLGPLPPDEERLVAIKGPVLPEYYNGDMELSVTVDRGDVWYDFPFDDLGKEKAQPVGRRPRATIYTKYLDQQIPLARIGTTIGGWRSELVEGTVMWKYKNSPVGPRVWHQIVAAPVWLPPNTTPPKELLKRNPGKNGREKYEPNYHETGPSYASAYGLVAAYHVKYRERPDGTIELGGDEGIRMHGSVDYMSIMRRHSHGCHRLHNHLAVRLMSFVLAHRPHRRVGQQKLGFRMPLEHDGHSYLMEINEGGYVFQLARPVPVEVLEGRIRSERQTPIEHAIPKFNEELQAYVMPDGAVVRLGKLGNLIPTGQYHLDAGVPLAAADGGVGSATSDAGAPADGGVRLPDGGSTRDAGVPILSMDDIFGG